MTVPAVGTTPLDPVARWLDHHRFRPVAVVFLVVVAASLLGLTTRPLGPLASFWPANAVLAGCLIALPVLVRWWTVPVAATAFFLADAMTPDPVLDNLVLTTTNLLNAGAAYLILRSLPELDRRLGRPASIIGVFAAAAGAALVSSTAMFRPMSNVLDAGPGQTWLAMVGVEFANQMVLLPVVLALGSVAAREARHAYRLVTAAVATALVLLGLSLMVLIGGPGALAFTLPGLLVVALTQPVLRTAAFAVLTTAVTLIALGKGWIDLTGTGSTGRATLMSAQIGLSVMAMGPLAVSCLLDSRDAMLRDLKIRSTVDGLTGALIRNEFLSRCARLDRWPASVLMLDIDLFKEVNDTYGHGAGDEVLARLGSLIGRHLREHDVFGRLGGEEFAVVLPATAPETARAIAERIRGELRQERYLSFDRDAPVTVSIGIAHGSGDRPLGTLLASADRLLYRAKAAGRNRVVCEQDHVPTAPEDGAVG